MIFDIYQSKTHSKIFVFVEAGVDPPIVLSDNIQEKTGTLALFKKNIEINEGDPLIGASPAQVIANVKKRGYHIQGVKVKTEEISDVGAALGGGLLIASLGGGPIGAIIGAAVGYFLAYSAKEEDDDS